MNYSVEELVGNYNFGAISVLEKLNKKYRLDLADKLYKLDITGSKLWMLYKDICNEDIDKTIEYIDKL